jgi:hypothetical protein
VFYGQQRSVVKATLPWAVSVLMVAAVAASMGADGALLTLRKEFGQAIEYDDAPAPHMRYCPDNTCEAFRGGAIASGEDVADFALLYLWGVSRYTYLERWRGSPSPPEVQAALERGGRSCAAGTEVERLACTLRRLAKKAEIRITFVRYDEGAVATDQLDLETELRRERPEP